MLGVFFFFLFLLSWQEIFARRLAQFYKSTSPLLSYYSAHPLTKLVTLTGTTSDEIWPKLDSAVRASFPTLRERAHTPEGRRRHHLSDAVVAGGGGGGGAAMREKAHERD